MARTGLEKQKRDQERRSVLGDHQDKEDDDVVQKRIVRPGAERLLEQHDAKVLQPDEVAAYETVPGVPAVEQRGHNRDGHEGEHDDQRRREQARDPEPSAEIVLEQEHRLRYGRGNGLERVARTGSSETDG